MTKRIIIGIILTVIVSFFLFPVSFTFLPETLNSKKILAALGIAAFVIHCIRHRTLEMHTYVIVSALLAILFSLWCLYSITANGTDDTTYVMYWVSFATWTLGAYGVCAFFRLLGKSPTLANITKYAAITCLAQCITAILIDRFPAFESLVNSVFVMEQSFFNSIHRLYGIGAALDSAGVVFSVVLVLIAHQITQNEQVAGKGTNIFLYSMAFVVITIMGNMISRTTFAGFGLGSIYMLAAYLYRHRDGLLTTRNTRLVAIFTLVLVIAVIASIVLYRTNPTFRSYFRFAFEAFFNWVETGEFRTDSTDKLNNVMWIWPTDTRSWIIGTGIFGHFIYSTDIGYCRFTLYCGLVGLVLFSIYFIYNGLSLIPKFRSSTLLFLLLIAMTFIIWVKVATDIFFIYALLFCAEGDPDPEPPPVPCESSIA